MSLTFSYNIDCCESNLGSITSHDYYKLQQKWSKFVAYDHTWNFFFWSNQWPFMKFLKQNACGSSQNPRFFLYKYENTYLKKKIVVYVFSGAKLRTGKLDQLRLQGSCMEFSQLRFIYLTSMHISHSSIRLSIHLSGHRNILFRQSSSIFLNHKHSCQKNSLF